MKDLIQKLKTSALIKNVLRISSGSLAGQIIVFLTLPFVTRIYGDAIIGEWTFLCTISYVVNSFSDIGLINAMMMEKDDKALQQTYKVITSCVLVISLISSVLFYLYCSFLAPDSFSLNPLFIAVYLFLSIFTLQQTQVCYTWLNRKKNYKVLMRNPVINNVVYSVLAIAFGLMGMIEYGYFTSWIIGQIVTLLVMRAHLPRGLFAFKLADYKDVFKRNKRFTVYQLPTNVLAQLKNQIPNLLIKPLFGVSALGQYSAAMKLIGMPINLLGNAIGKVFFQTSSEMVRKGKPVGEFTYKSITVSMKIVTIPVILILAFGDIIFNWYLGPGWEIGGNIVRILSLQAFFLFLSISLQGITITINKQKYAMFSFLAQSAAMAISLAIGSYVFNNIYIGLAIFAASFVLINIVYFSCLFKVMKVPPHKYILHSLFYIVIIFTGYLVVRIPMVLLGLVGSL